MHPMKYALFALVLSTSLTTWASSTLLPKEDSWKVTGRHWVAKEGIYLAWPGSIVEVGTSAKRIGFQINDPDGGYNLYADDVLIDILRQPDDQLFWFDLPANTQTVKLVKRTESTEQAAIIRAIVTEPQGAFTPLKNKLKPQIEFIGDSFFAAYGVESTTTGCSPEEIIHYTNAEKSFAVRTAHELDAEYHLNAYSGKGMVRNWNGEDADMPYPFFYPRSLTPVSEPLWQLTDEANTWHPSLFVIGLGGNDFSTYIQAHETWDKAALFERYVQSYTTFIKRLKLNNPKSKLILMARNNTGKEIRQTDAISAVYQQAIKHYPNDVYYFDYDTGEVSACQWHPAESMQESMAKQLSAFIRAKDLL